jgi:3-isopropylmalate/(R)-2-methylmalate dehydratase large subunit
MSFENNSARPERMRFQGRILFLTEDTTLIRQQLEAEGDERQWLEGELAQRLLNEDLPLMSNISTDEITPGWVCFYYDETLGQYVYVGMRDAAVKKDEVKNGGFAVVVSGLSKGCGSSRETAPYAEKAAGIQLVIAKSIEKIYGQNSQNIGLLTSTDFSLIERIRAKKSRSTSSPAVSIRFPATLSNMADYSITTKLASPARSRRRRSKLRRNSRTGQ